MNKTQGKWSSGKGSHNLCKKHDHYEFPGGPAVKNPVLSLKQHGSLLWYRFNPWPRNFHVLQAWPKKKKKKKKKHPTKTQTLQFFIYNNHTYTNIYYIFLIVLNRLHNLNLNHNGSNILSF